MMSRLALVLMLWAIISCATTSVCGQVTEVRPRLILDAAMISEIKKSLFTYRKDEYASMLRYADYRIGATRPDKLAYRNYQPAVMMPLYAAAYFSGEKKYINYVKDAILGFAEIPLENSTDLEQRFRLMMLSVGFDWFHDEFDDQQKKQIVVSIQNYINILKPFLESPVYIGGHSRLASASILYGLLGTWEYWESSRRDKLFSILVEQWRDGYNLVQGYVSGGGGSHMGWQYSSHMSIWPYLAWKATLVSELNEFPDFVKSRPLWYIYGLRGDRTFPRLGDINDARLGESWNQIIAFSAAVNSDPYAEWFYRKYLSDSWDPYRVWRFLYQDSKLEPRSPDSNLSYDKLFSNSGIAIFRDSWGGDTTQAVLKSSSFDSVTHHHRDQNHIEISRRGSLLIDSGVYDAYGSEHWLNYYSRSIAHNTLLLNDVDSEFKVLHRKTVNDGGQRYPVPHEMPKGEQPASLEELVSDKYKLDGISSFGTSDVCGYTIGNAASSYRTSKLKKFERLLVFVRPAKKSQSVMLVVVDEISKALGVGARLLFHSNDRPNKVEDYWEIKNESGALLRIEFPLELSPSVTLVGGAGHEWDVNGVNFQPLKVKQSAVSGNNVDAGAWRLELGIEESEMEKIMVSVMRVNDAANENSMESVFAMKYKWGMAVFSEGDLVLIPLLSSIVPSNINLDEFSGESVKRIVVAGEKANFIARRIVGVSVNGVSDIPGNEILTCGMDDNIKYSLH